MFPHKSSSYTGRIGSALMIFAAGCGAALTCLVGTAAYAQTPTQEERIQGVNDALNAAADECHFNGVCGQVPAAQTVRIGVDPCYLAQNAMRPCTSDQRQVSKPVGVDPHLVGTWELPFKGGPWVLKILRNGVYTFHSDARDGAPSNAGIFSASNGHWSLKTRTGYTDGGNYLFQAPDVWIATGKLGAAAWLRPALARDAMRQCVAEQQQPSKAVGVDLNLVGTWELPLKGGPWVWEILRDGTYKFHSEARDGAPSHTGTFSASNGHWSLAAMTGLTGYTDAGLYLFQAPDILIATGRLGAAAWRRPASKATLCNAARR